MKSSLAFFQKHILPALVCFGLALALAQTEWLQRVENLTLDARTRLRTNFFPTPPRDDVVLIAIDQPSLNLLGRWPWPRGFHGEFMLYAGLASPSVVVWDLLFDDPNEQDARFAEGIRNGGAEVVLAGQGVDADLGLKPDDEALKKLLLAPLTRIEGDRSAILSTPAMAVPRAPLGEVADLGFADTPPGPDGFRREAPLVVQVGDRVYPTLALRSLMHYWHATSEHVLVRLGDAVIVENSFVRRRIPIDGTGAYLINYRHSLEGFLRYPYGATLLGLSEHFKEKRQGPKPVNLTGRILLVGQTADGLADLGPTPFSSLTPLVLVHANVLENVLNDDFARHAATAPIWIGGMAMTAASLVFFATRKFREQAVFSVGVPVIYGLVATMGWIKMSVWVPVVWPVLGFGTAQIFMLGRRVLAEQRAKEQIKGMFGTYVSPALVSRMVASGVSPQLGGHDDEITAYFSDIQSFSTFSEKLGSGPLVELMNEYLTACTDIVQEEGGTLDKYIGDAVVAMFGAPIPLADHALRACVATQRVHLKLGELRVKWQSETGKWPEIVHKMQTRIGLNSGVCMIGNMGSRTRFNYTMMGDNVNLAARMESGAKQWGSYTMCAEATKLACEKHGAERVVFRPLGRIVVKGRSTAVPIFEIVGLKENVTAQTRECIGLFSQAMEKYYARDWDGALALFAQSRELEFNVPGKTPGVSSNPSLVYLDITEHYKHEPPAENWDGTYIMKEK